MSYMLSNMRSGAAPQASRAATSQGTGLLRGHAGKWAQAVIDAKHGDDKSVVMLSILNTETQWKPSDRIGTLVKMFPYHYLEDALAADYGPAFVEAASLVETACAGFTPPPG